jgi:hypothetical protein
MSIGDGFQARKLVGLGSGTRELLHRDQRDLGARW